MTKPLSRAAALGATLALVAGGLTAQTAHAAGSVDLAGTYVEDFGSLLASPDGATSNVLPIGWWLAETGTSASNDGAYRVGTGSSNAGDTYAFGTSGSTERALGGVRSGTLVPVVGAQFTNTTGATIGSLAVSYTGEQWRLGQNTSGRAPDRLDFQVSVDATSLTTGSWSDIDGLDLASPVVAGTVGALNGNDAANQVAVSGTVTGLAIPAGASFWIRWVDADLVPGADDGLAIDGLSLTPAAPSAEPILSVGDASATEGDPGSTTSLAFTVSLTAPAGTGGVAFDVATADGTATVADGDYVATALTGVAIPAGASSTTFTVDVRGDAAIEPDEAFAVAVTNVIGATAGDVAGEGTIRNDDVALTPIHEIQGAGHVSPLRGQVVTTAPAVVTALRTEGGTRGFYLQDPTPDAELTTSDAIFVFTGSSSNPAALVAVGDLVRVRGTVTEFRPAATNLSITELTGPTVTRVSAGNPLPAPVVLGDGGRVPPASVIDDDASGDVETTGTFDPVTDGIDFFESLEGMLVRVDDAVATGPTSDFGSNREIPVVGNGGANAGLRTPGGGIVVRPDDFNPERIFLNDWIAGGPDLPAANVGDRLPGSVVGVVDYSFANFKLQVVSMPSLVAGGLQPEAAAQPGPDDLAVATFNVENLSPTDPPEKFARLADLIVTNLRAPDVVALEEIQDANGTTNDANVDAAATYETLIAAIQTAGGPTYDYRQIDPVDDQDGGAPGGNIRQAFLFRTDRGLAFVDRPGAGSTTSNTVLGAGAETRLEFSPGRIDPTNVAFASSRKPLAAEVLFRGHRLFLIANHFNSKGGDEPLFGRFQPPTRSSEVQRHQQARIVNDFVGQLLAADPQANVIVLGDINDFQFSETLALLTGAELTTLIDTLPEAERYSYVFEGNAQVLDHILLSDALLGGRPFAYDVVHVNAEFADQASDHDPQLVAITLNDAPTTDAGGPYAVVEGATAQLTATGADREDDARALGLTYAWDLDGDGTFETPGVTVPYVGPPLAAPGTRTVAVRVTDSGGRTATDTATVQIRYPFAGFLSPVDDPPTVNVARAGSVIPVRFRLGGNRGPDVLATGSPTSRSIACPPGRLDSIEETLDRDEVGLVYRRSTASYRYGWRTSRAWAGTCRELTVTLADGTAHRALFLFRRTGQDD